jgi:hypothetical protein
VRLVTLNQISQYFAIGAHLRKYALHGGND